MKLNKLISILSVSAIISILSSGCSYQPIFTADDINPGAVITELRRTIEISPSSGTISGTGLLFYPGGLVDSHVYNQLLADFVAAAGVTAVVVKMPANLAVFNINAGLTVISDFPEIKEWIIAGHSLGGSMAASTVASNPDTYKGLIFMDSYPAAGDSLKLWDGVVLSLFSSIDKVEDPARMEQTLSLIPPATELTAPDTGYPAAESNYSVLHTIEGGSHSYFGTYGPQAGDFTPTISRSEFHAYVVDYMLEFFNQNGWR